MRLLGLYPAGAQPVKCLPCERLQSAKIDLRLTSKLSAHDTQVAKAPTEKGCIGRGECQPAIIGLKKASRIGVQGDKIDALNLLSTVARWELCL
jgi:hypothetical protein